MRRHGFVFSDENNELMSCPSTLADPAYLSRQLKLLAAAMAEGANGVAGMGHAGGDGRAATAGGAAAAAAAATAPATDNGGSYQGVTSRPGMLLLT